MLALKERKRVQKMSRYLYKNYSSGSILERASYKKTESRPFKMYDKTSGNKKEKALWQKLKTIMAK